MSRKATLVLMIALVLAGIPLQAAIAEKASAKNGVEVDGKIMATPKVAFAALRSLRDDPSSTCKILSSTADSSVVQEIFDGLPIIGSATCVYREVYDCPKSIKFKMIRSDKLKAFEGEWLLEAVDRGEHTHVKLRTYIDTGLKVPFAHQITAATSKSELKEQIGELKQVAESKQKELAAQGKNGTL